MDSEVRLIKGKYALGQYCTVQKERGSLGYKPKVPAKRKLKRTLWYLSTKRDVPNVSTYAYCRSLIETQIPPWHQCLRQIG